MIGNGYCNDEPNNADCNYDGGDCCKLIFNLDHCTECICHHQVTCVGGVNHEWVNNGICNDETNNTECNFDGGDCEGCAGERTRVLMSRGRFRRYLGFHRKWILIKLFIRNHIGQRLLFLFNFFRCKKYIPLKPKILSSIH